MCLYLGSEQQIVDWLASLAQEALETLDGAADDWGISAEAFSRPVQVQTFNQLGVIVVRLFAYMFTKTNNVWPVTRVIGQSLNRYADILDAGVLS